MKKRSLSALIAMTLLVAVFSLFACTSGNSQGDITEATSPADTAADTQAPQESSTEAPTETPTEAETEAPLPTTVSLPDAYAMADVEYECDDGSVLYAFNGKSVADFEAICAYYMEQGFEVYRDTSKVDNRFTTFVGDGPMAHVYWLKDNGELNIVLSETAATTLPPVTPAVQDGTYEPFVMQLKDNAHVNGMCYIIRLKDGSFIVYDGSYSDQARKLTKLLKENRSIMDNMSRVLVERETIYTEEVAMLMKGADYKEVIAFMDAKEDTHKENPFAQMTTPSKEHVVADETDEQTKDE